MRERWIDIAGYVGVYMVSSRGRVKSLARLSPCGGGMQWLRERILKAAPTSKYGHLSVGLYKNYKKTNHKVHQLVLRAFKGPAPKSMECRHLNSKPEDNRLSNLVYSTHVDNMKDCVANGTSTRGEGNGGAKLKEADVLRIRSLVAAGTSQIDIAKLFGVSRTCVSYIQHRKRWKHI